MLPLASRPAVLRKHGRTALHAGRSDHRTAYVGVAIRTHVHTHTAIAAPWLRRSAAMRSDGCNRHARSRVCGGRISFCAPCHAVPSTSCVPPDPITMNNATCTIIFTYTDAGCGSLEPCVADGMCRSNPVSHRQCIVQQHLPCRQHVL